MKHLLLVLVLFVSTGCLFSRAEDATLMPAIVNAWPAVRSDVMEATTPPTQAVSDMDAAIEANSKPMLQLVPWAVLNAAGADGIQNQLNAGTIGPNGFLLLTEQLNQMNQAMLQIQKPLLSPQARGLPTASQRVAERRLSLSYSNPYAQ